MKAHYLLVVLAGCASGKASDPGLEGLAISKVAPGTVIPGTKIVVKGDSFVGDDYVDGQNKPVFAAQLHLVGKAGDKTIDEEWPAKFVDFSTMTVAVDAAKIDALGGDVDFDGTVAMEFVSVNDNETYKSPTLTQKLSFRKKLTPSPTGGFLEGVIFINDQIGIDGTGFLLGGDEGTTYARITGCFKLAGSGPCMPIATQEIALQPTVELQREHAEFPFSPHIAGIKAGDFIGKVQIVNKQATAVETAADPLDVSYSMVTSQVFSADPGAASLGQYVFVHGGGFVGGEPAAYTELELNGTFNKTGGNPFPAQMYLLPEFVEGKLVRYVINTDDALGHSMDLRTETGHFSGTVTPIIHYNTDAVRGVSTNVTFDIAAIKQVVHLNFSPSYIEGLRDFGLRAVEKSIRKQILSELARIYKGVNIEFRNEPVTDFALFEEVTLMGVDPNNMGLFGYDNSPGKDDGNMRLYDQLGGVNATTQQDGYPGYGGVFLRSLMGFSKHPGSFAKAVPGADDTFDKIFDPFRSDQNGNPVTASDLSGGELQLLSSGDQCPSSDRKARIQCAVWVIGNLIGGTLGHEIGHSLGLANPYSEGFHDAGDEPQRLMDAGGDRPFLERAQVQGEAGAVFCDDEYDYLRQVMPSKEPPNAVTRPSCY